MRWFYWASTLSILLLYHSSLAQAACPTCNGQDNIGYRTYCGPACFTPPGYCMAPGCCECPPSACDNAWEGYCGTKARWQAFFYRVGTPCPSRYGSCCLVPMPAGSCHCQTADEGETIQKEVKPQPTSAAKPAAQPVSHHTVAEPQRLDLQRSGYSLGRRR